MSIKRLSDKKFVAAHGNDEFSIEWDRTDYWNHGVYELEKDLRCVALLPISDKKYVYAISDDSKVFVCCNQRDGTTLWQARIKGMEQKVLLGNTSSSLNYVEIVSCNDTVSVFCGSAFGSFFGAYNLFSGEKICSFTTGFELPKSIDN